MLVHHSMGRILELAHFFLKMHLDWRIDLPLRLNASFIRILPWVCVKAGDTWGVDHFNSEIANIFHKKDALG